MKLYFHVSGQPVPWKRARRRGKRYYTAREESSYRTAVAWAAKRNLPPGYMLTGDPLRLGLEVSLACPSTWSRQRKEAAWACQYAPSRRPDLDNYVKLVLDALSGLVWHDDSQVVELSARKAYSQTPGLTVLVQDDGTKRPPR